MAKYIPGRNYIGSSEIATDLDVTGPVDIDGAVQINNTLTVGVDDTGYDVKFFGATSGRYLLWDESGDYLKFTDGAQAVFGTGGDLGIQHDGSNSYISQGGTGNLYIQQNTADKDLILQCDDGSGGTTEYFRLDGGTGVTEFSRGLRMADSQYLTVGTGSDLIIYHSGTNSFIQNGNGDLYIKNTADDGDIYFQSDDGSGGLTAYLTLDGSSATNIFSKDVLLTDNISLKIGSAADLKLYHDGSNSYIDQQGTGNLYIRNTTDDADIIFQSDDGSGGLATYFYLDGSEASSGYLFTRFPDNSLATFGDSHDLQIYHYSGNSHILNYTGDLNIVNYADDKDIIFKSDNGTGSLTTYFSLDGSLADGTYFYTKWPDNSIIALGSSNDLVLWHDGSNSYIRQVGTGDLYIENTTDDKDIIFRCDDSSGSVEEYFRLDGSANSSGEPYTIWPDSSIASWGSGADLRIKHDGSNSYISQVGTGDLIIENKVDDKDIIFQSDDGSGGVTAYLTLDGSHSRLNVPDNIQLTIGTGIDSKMYHNGTNTYFENVTGDWYFDNHSNDKDIIFRNDNGSGGVTAYLTLDGSATTIKIDQNTRVLDGKYIAFGSGSDLQLSHDGSHSYMIQNGVGNLYIRQSVADADLILQCDDGSGGETAYITLDGSDTDIKVHKNFEIEKTLTMQHTADPSDPATGHSVMWSDTSGNLKVKINVGGSVVTRTLATGTD